MARREHPRYESMEWPDYEFQEFPMMVYPGAPDPLKPYVQTKGRNKGKPLQGVIVQNEEEMRRALDLPPESDEDDEDAAPRPRHLDQHDRVTAGQTLATSSPGVSRLATVEDEKAKLVEEAEVLGVQIDKRWSPARIQDAIDSHRAEVV